MTILRKTIAIALIPTTALWSASVALFFIFPSTAFAADIQAVLDDAAGASAFSVQDSGSTEKLRVDSNGNVTPRREELWLKRT